MEYRALGKTGMNVSALSFGGSPLGSVFRPISQEQADRAVRSALDAGINLFDVAPLYGETLAETVLGKALEGVPRDQYYLSTKTGRFKFTEFDFSPKRVRRSVDESLQRLKTDHIDLLFCHDIEFVDIRPVVEETIPTLREIQAEGKIKFVGVSGFPLKIFDIVLAETELDVILAYCHYTLQNQRLLSLLPKIKACGMGIISASPLTMGLLTKHTLPEWHPAPQHLRTVAREAFDYCESRGVSLPDLALQFAIANPDLDTVLTGMAEEVEVQRNLRAIASSMDTEVLEEVQRILEPIRDVVWSSGLAENN
jgi:aryl-alcohol dehydrogenase-like predicted oxidoreductase